MEAARQAQPLSPNGGGPPGPMRQRLHSAPPPQQLQNTLLQSPQQQQQLSRPPAFAPPQLNVMVVSTDHILHRLADIEALTPRHSLLLPLRDLDAHVMFTHAPSPFTFSADVAAKRQSKLVHYAGQLTIVLANLQGVERSTDFLQKESVRRLADVRAALNDALWQLMPAHGGQRALYSPLQSGESGGDGGVVTAEKRAMCELACVEAAVAALGKAQARLAPLIADPIHASVSAEAIHEARAELCSACASLHVADPDRPIRPQEMMELLRGQLEQYVAPRR